MNIYMLLMIVSVVINLVLSKKISNSILHPVRIFVIMWSIFIILPVLFWNISYIWKYVGLLWISLAVFFTEVGALLGGKYVLKGKVQTKLMVENISIRSDDFSWFSLWMIIILAFISVFLSLLKNGFHLTDVLSVSGLLNVSVTNAAERYSEGQSTSTIMQILSTFVYLSALCGGYAYSFAVDKKQKIVTVIAIMPIVFEMLFTSGKSGFIASVILWLSGWFVSSLRLKGSLPKVKAKSLVLGAIGFFAFLGVLYFVMLLRTGDFSNEMRSIIFDKFWIYAFGHMVEFDGWFAEHGAFSDYNMGINTYMMIFKTMGLVERVQGVYDIYVSGYGNVFTAFRGVLTDFGLFGGLIYCLIRGFITQICINTISGDLHKGIFPAMLIVCAYFWNIYGFIISPWIYTTYVLMIVFFGGFILHFHRKVRFGNLKL